MSAVSGLLAVDGGASTGEWVSEYQQSILVRNSKGLNVGTTLFGLMSKLKNEPAETTEYKWFERDPVSRTVSSSAIPETDSSGPSGTDSASAGVWVALDDGSGGSVNGLVQQGTILKHIPAAGGGNTAEYLRVTSAAPTTVSSLEYYKVERAFGGTSAVAVADNDTFVILTLGKDEGANPSLAAFETATEYVNYIQTFNSTVNLTNAFKGSKLRTDIEGPLKERRLQALERIARDQELAYFFGNKSKTNDSTDNGFRYYTGGIQEAVDTVGGNNVMNGAGSTGVTLTALHDWLQSFLVVGSDSKLAFCGPKAYAAISRQANDAANGFRITGQEHVFGMNITAINTPFGELDLVMHPLFKEVTEYNDWAVVVDLALLSQKVMEPLFLEPNVQTPGADAYKEQFRGKYGLKLKFPEAFGYAYNFEKVQ